MQKKSYEGIQVGLRELCSKFLSLFYSEFSLKSFHYAYLYSYMPLIVPSLVHIILSQLLRYTHFYVQKH